MRTFGVNPLASAATLASPPRVRGTPISLTRKIPQRASPKSASKADGCRLLAPRGTKPPPVAAHALGAPVLRFNEAPFSSHAHIRPKEPHLLTPQSCSLTQSNLDPWKRGRSEPGLEVPGYREPARSPIVLTSSIAGRQNVRAGCCNFSPISPSFR